MTAWHEGDLTANGIRIHYTRTGAPSDAKPAVVLAHGFSDDGLCWTPVAAALADDYDVIMVDARGHGRSAAPEDGYGAVEQAADLRDFIAALGLRRPAVLGHSMGALTALVLAGNDPDVPGAILLEDPPDRWMAASKTGSGDTLWQERMRVWLAGLKRMSRDEKIATERAVNPGWSDAELGPWADAKERVSLNVLNRANDTPLDLPATARRIRCPALLLTGDVERGALVSPDAAVALQALVPQLRIAHIPGAGHSVRRDRFSRYLEVVRGFLGELPQA